MTGVAFTKNATHVTRVTRVINHLALPDIVGCVGYDHILIEIYNGVTSVS